MLRCRRVPAAGDLGLRRACSNRAAWIAALASGAVALGGCSISLPVKGVEADAAPTGSIDRTAALLPPALDREDLRRARAALAVTLDPQGYGARSGWQNPQSGAHGSFTAAGVPFADQDVVCRRFRGDVTPAGGAERRLAGSACRGADGSWQVRAGGDV